MRGKILVYLINISNTILLVLMISLGSQNLSDTKKINFGFSSTSEAYPTGFLIGISTILGSISGGLATILLVPSSKNYS